MQDQVVDKYWEYWGKPDHIQVCQIYIQVHSQRIHLSPMDRLFQTSCSFSDVEHIILVYWLSQWLCQQQASQSPTSAINLAKFAQRVVHIMYTYTLCICTSCTRIHYVFVAEVAHCNDIIVVARVTKDRTFCYTSRQGCKVYYWRAEQEDPCQE